jgi:hypothetical protein
MSSFAHGCHVSPAAWIIRAGSISGPVHLATWWISSQIRAERENCCDDIVIEISHKREIYVTALAAIAEMQITLAPAATGAPLLPRIQRLLHGTTNQRQPWFVEFSVFALVVLVFL